MAFVGPALFPIATSNGGGLILTFVVDGGVGCNLKCPGCIIVQRKEALANVGYNGSDYERFISSIAQREEVAVVSVQGYEPLLPHTIPLTRAIIEAGANVGSRTALVTNGTYLEENISWLDGVGIDKVIVSLDGADPNTHDRARGVRGCFATAVRGLEKALANSWLARRMVVASILRRGKCVELEGLPALLAELGIHSWVVSPFYKVGRSGSIGEYGMERAGILDNFLRLHEIARQFNIEMLVDDEFDMVLRGSLGIEATVAGLQVKRFPHYDNVLRLSPDGSLSVGKEILERTSRNPRRWRPSDDPHAFVVAARKSANLVGEVA